MRNRQRTMNKKVLIVDDEPDVATYLATILKTNGYEPIVANDAKTGLKTASDVRPALVCLDIMMPQESGISMYTRLKQEKTTRDIPVIIISGVSQNEEFDFRSYIPDKSIPPPENFMEKPIDVETFLEVVNDLTSSRSINNNSVKK